MAQASELPSSWLAVTVAALNQLKLAAPALRHLQVHDMVDWVQCINERPSFWINKFTAVSNDLTAKVHDVWIHEVQTPEPNAFECVYCAAQGIQRFCHTHSDLANHLRTVQNPIPKIQK